MGFFNSLFGKRSMASPSSVGNGIFSNLSQPPLNHLASLPPVHLADLRSMPSFDDASESNSPEDIWSQRLVKSLTDTQYNELRAIQNLFWAATVAATIEEKLKLSLQCIERAPWHIQAIKDVGVIYSMAGSGMGIKLGEGVPWFELASGYMKRCIELKKDDVHNRANEQRIETEREAYLARNR
jgi:hypothetical protein